MKKRKPHALLLLSKMPLLLTFFISFFTSLAISAHATQNDTTLRIATASNFLPTLKILAQQFEQTQAITVDIISGSSGKLFTQIKHGLPVDLFLSADQEKPRLLKEAGLAANNAVYTYAQGALIFWGTQVTDTREASNNDVLSRLFHAITPCKNISIANPKLAPYGKASAQSLAVLSNQTTFELSNTPLITGENITQSLYFKISHNADCAFIAKSQAVQLNLFSSEQAQSLIQIPSDWYTPIIQQAVILRSSQKTDDATLFMQFLLSDKTQQFIQEQGYLNITSSTAPALSNDF